MVNKIIQSSLLMLCLAASLFSAEIEVIVGSDTAAEGAKIPVTVNVMTENGDSIDAGSFLLGNKSIELSFLHNSVQSSVHIINGRREDHSTVTSAFQFEIEGRGVGEHQLPELSVKVNGVRVVSKPIIFEISGAEYSEGFRLEASIAGRTPIYPGQQIDLLYRIFFSENLDLTHKDLPMLEGVDGLKKVGEQKLTGYRTGNYTVQEIKQTFEASKAGHYHFPLGSLEGVIYEEDFFGNKTYQFPRLRAEAESDVLEVREFPSRDQPVSFNGALGDYQMKVKMLSSKELYVGDKIELQLILIGKGEANTLRAPDLAKQDAFTKDFRLSDLPPKMETIGSNRVFTVEIRPLNEHITEVPAIEYSYFNPKIHQYQTILSTAFPINVKSLKASQSDTSSPKMLDDEPSSPTKAEPELEDDFVLETPPAIEIAGNIAPKKEDPVWIQQAYAFYQKGERAETLTIRQKAFNRSIELYMKADLKKNDAALLYNIGNTYYQLGEYSQAIYYYQKASLLSPRWGKLHQNLSLAQEKNGLESYQMNRLLSKQEKQSIFYACLLMALGSLFVAVSTRQMKKRRVAAALTIGLVFASLFFVYHLHLAPVKAVLTQGSYLRRDAGTHYAPVAAKPLRSGDAIEILNVEEHRDWAQVSTRDGLVGYVPQEYIRSIE